MASAILAMLLETRGREPLYIVIADVLAAYDNVWRQALWAKMLDAHKIVMDVKRVAAMYEKFLSFIREAGFESGVVEAFLGLPQEDPEVGTSFASSRPTSQRSSRLRGWGSSSSECSSAWQSSWTTT